ncbi:uncharacterized protein [Blastocystis hominis]|uniref:FLZ-type domain-containing protein n=1 Tax=Blastocystis hominis TaxID=12968 RepID=D8M2F7_BLAHO|nr:uncharacterized protein [Blastocystis hominis]CBK22246.2 unnamed protein product [Blastocystis hominis]|eukprot:XP_012896294.1 uncharacterized protein [Blastocystis hominis]
MNSQQHYMYVRGANDNTAISPRNNEFLENEQYEYILRCKYCKNPIREDSNVYMFLDNKFCSETCRDNAIMMYEQRHY